MAFLPIRLVAITYTPGAKPLSRSEAIRWAPIEASLKLKVSMCALSGYTLLVQCNGLLTTPPLRMFHTTGRQREGPGQRRP